MNRNSALLWFPPIEAIPSLLTPRTIFVPYAHMKAVGDLEQGGNREMGRLCAAVQAAAEEVGYPVFIRTDLSSAKHDGPSSYLVHSAADVQRVVVRTVEDNEMKFWLEKDGPQAFMVRQFLDLDAGFTAFGGLPIAREWRFFVKAGEPLCHHGYWPVDAIQFFGEEPNNWREVLAAHHRIDPATLDLLQGLALEAAEACGGGFWSVDFARDQSGQWWLLDMAHGADSWHWPGCANGPEGGERCG